MCKRVKKTELHAFLQAVNSCSDEVWLQTENGDRLDLKSELNKIMFLAIMTGNDRISPEEYFIEYSDGDKIWLEPYLESDAEPDFR